MCRMGKNKRNIDMGLWSTQINSNMVKVFINNTVVRWIAVLPMTLVAAIAAMFHWHWLVLLNAWAMDSLRHS